MENVGFPFPAPRAGPGSTQRVGKHSRLGRRRLARQPQRVPPLRVSDAEQWASHVLRRSLGRGPESLSWCILARDTLRGWLCSPFPSALVRATASRSFFWFWGGSCGLRHRGLTRLCPLVFHRSLCRARFIKFGGDSSAKPSGRELSLLGGIWHTSGRWHGIWSDHRDGHSWPLCARQGGLRTASHVQVHLSLAPRSASGEPPGLRGPAAPHSRVEPAEPAWPARAVRALCPRVLLFPGQEDQPGATRAGGAGEGKKNVCLSVLAPSEATVSGPRKRRSPHPLTGFAAC